jgi:hypothetical protein
VSAEDNTLCLRCHAVDPARLSPGEHFQLTDGVNCESCHGPAERWKAQHYQPGWRQLDARQKAALGFRETKDLVARARGCVECHVGSEGKDVNHDLIAAGHPRLRFEYGAYLANYPKHWSERADKAGRPDFEERAWAVGQVVSARAAAELLRYRASTSGKPWPEFAEYDCFACHHDLRAETWRQQPPPGNRTPGSLPWGTWYFALLPTLARLQPAEAPTGGADFRKLRNLMSWPGASREAVRDEARAAAALLDPWSSHLAAAPPRDARSLARLLRGLAEERPPAEAGWDGAVQLYLAIAATYNGLGDVAPPYRADLPLKGAVRDLGAELQKTLPRGPEGRYSSPRDFCPQLLERRLDALRRQLYQLGLE